MLLVAALAGFGGGNFASSMTNISCFYPEKEKGWALGLNAAGGNIGVAVVQAPFVVAARRHRRCRHPPRAGRAALHPAGPAGGRRSPGGTWTTSRWRKTDFASSAAVARKPHTWVMSFLYIGTFGSFIGYAAAFPPADQGPVPRGQRDDLRLPRRPRRLAGPTARRQAVRPGRRCAGHGGSASWRWRSACSAWSGRSSLHSFGLFFAAFMLLFVATGVGNGSTYRMIPAIFRHEVDGADAGAVTVARRQARRGDRHHLRDRCLRRLPGAAHLRLVDGERSARSCPRCYVYVGVYAVMLAVTWVVLPAPRRSDGRGRSLTGRAAARGPVRTHCPYCALQCAMTLSRRADGATQVAAA